jgi:hypothetical protein
MKVLKSAKILIVSFLCIITLPLLAHPYNTDSTFAFGSKQTLIAKKSNACDLFLTINSVTCDNKSTNITTDDEVIIVATMTGSNGQAWEMSRKESHQFETAVHLGNWVGDQTITFRVNIKDAVAGYDPTFDRFELWYMITGSLDCTGDVFVFVPECPCVSPDAGADKKICLGTPSVKLTGNPLGGTWSAINGGIVDNNGNVSGLLSVGKYAFVYENNLCKDTVVVETVEPKAEAMTLSPTCKEIGINNDGKIKLYNFAVGDKYQYSVGEVFNGVNAIPAQREIIPNDGLIVSNLESPVLPKSYTIRVYNEQGCSKDTTVVMEPAKCCEKQICMPFLITKSR